MFNITIVPIFAVSQGCYTLKCIKSVFNIPYITDY